MTVAPAEQSLTSTLTPNDELALVRQQLHNLMISVHTEAEQRLQVWQPWIKRPEYWESAENLAHYLALRCHDVRDLQGQLVTWGVSSLGRCEPYVWPNLQAADAALSALAGQPQPLRGPAGFRALEGKLSEHTAQLFGEGPTPHIMVTFPSEAAENPLLVGQLLEAGMTVARINMAHDGPEAWAKMLTHVQNAAQSMGKTCRILMDLAGPKVRTGEVYWPKKANRLFVGDLLCLAKQEKDLPKDQVGTTCTLTEALAQVKVGEAVWFDDGKIGTRVEAILDEVLYLRVTHAANKGAKLKPEKGINFPDTTLDLPALTAKDRSDLAFAAQHADMLGYSFVQTVQDVEALLAALDHLEARAELGIVLKIETKLAVSQMAELMVRTAAERPCGVMIARGDLAVELGFSRLTEIQEQVMWLAEAAHIPVVWATQVLESLVKKGETKRGEFTDAADGVRAEVIMLNKGDYVVKGVQELSRIIAHMRPHFNKKRPQFRPLSVAAQPLQAHAQQALPQAAEHPEPTEQHTAPAEQQKQS